MDHDLQYLLFEKPFKEFVDEKGCYNTEVDSFIDDGHSVVLTFSMLLAKFMGFKNIYLLGCDCTLGSLSISPNDHFYDARHHTTKKSSTTHLNGVWKENGPIFKSYEIVGKQLESEGTQVYNATSGGYLDVFPRVDYDSLF